MNTAPISVVEKEIGGTTYIIESVVSDSAKETSYDKIKKLILNEANEYVKRKAS